MSLGGGVQSSTLAEMIVLGQLPPVDLVIFADTGDESGYTLDQVKYLKDRLASVDIPLHVVMNGKGLINNILDPGDRFASIPAATPWLDPHTNKIVMKRMRRQCTREFKLDPLMKFTRGWLMDRGHATRNARGAVRVHKDVQLTQLIGFSLDEATRMADPRVSYIKHSYPLIDLRMTRHSCRVWLKDHDLPIPGKSSCRICPFHSLAYWADMKENRPDDWDHVTMIDSFIRTESKFTAGLKGKLYLNKYLVPLTDLDMDQDVDQDQLDFMDLCGEVCFT